MAERIGAYRLESPLGRGGMGEVFLAWDERLERPVAIKRIRQDAFPQGHHRERFRREAQMAARLSHAAVVQIHDLVTEESGDAIVMEYVEGPTLAQRLSLGPLATEEALRLAREIAEGLAAAHKAGLIHRDLKAENVIVTMSGHAKILDFGLARPVSWDGEMISQHGVLIGTCYAMSPEQASGEDLDERSDLFSFGALLYEMLTGRSPFRGKDSLSTLQRVLHEQPPLLSEVRPDLPLRLSSLVERLLAKDRNDRPRDAMQVAHKLELIERELPVAEWPERSDDSVSDLPTYAFPALPGTRTSGTARRSLLPVEGPRSLHRSRGWILFLAGALSALVITVVILYFRSADPPPPKEISMSDFVELQKIKRRVSTGTNDLKGELARLEKIHETSSDLSGAWILAADLAGALYESTHEPADLDKARSFVKWARKLAPENLGTLRAEFRMAMATQQLKEAASILKRLEAVRPPGDPNVLLLRSSLMERQNHLEVAEKALREAVKQAPSSSVWYYKSELAWFELNHGKVPEARRHLEGLFKQYPENPSVRERLAYLELFYGKLERAEQLYGDLARAYPQQRTYFTSLGQARSLRRRYKEAKEAYSRAQDIDVGHKIVALNMADAEWDLGDRPGAKTIYGTLLKRLEETRIGTGLSPQEEMMKAQCLARLGYADQAREAARQALSQTPDDAQRLFEAALVYSVIGDPGAALNYAKESVSRGMRPRWLRASAFDPLRQKPDFQALLKSEGPEQGL
jgi:serine/threonine protein kinase/Flp pilus assembly protein TadD